MPSQFDTTTGGYQPPSQQATQTSDSSGWWDAARFLYGVYRDRNPKKPEFEQVPLSPEQRQVYQIYINSLLDPSTRDNASRLNEMATQMLGGMSGMRWQSPQTFSGQQGYSGSSMAYTPPQSGPSGGGMWPGGGGTPPLPPGVGGPPSTGGMGRPPDFVGPRPNIDPMGPNPSAGGVGDFWEKYAGKWNANEETWEKYISRAAAMAAAAFGLPIPPGMIDKGIDFAQWVYRSVAGKPQSPMDRFYGDAGGGIGGTGQSPGAQFGSAYGPGERPPGFGMPAGPMGPFGTTPRPPASGVGMTGGTTGYGGFGTGFGGFGAQPYGGPTPPPGSPNMFNPRPPASGYGVGGGTTGFEGFGAPGSVRPGPPPAPRPAPWTGSSTPHWTAPAGAFNPSDPNNPYTDVPWNSFGN